MNSISGGEQNLFLTACVRELNWSVRAHSERSNTTTTPYSVGLRIVKVFGRTGMCRTKEEAPQPSKGLNRPAVPAVRTWVRVKESLPENARSIARITTLRSTAPYLSRQLEKLVVMGHLARLTDKEPTLCYGNPKTSHGKVTGRH